MSYTLVRLEDWIGLYDPDGDLLYENHSIESSKLLDLVGIDHESIYIEDYDPNLGSLPPRLEDLPDE